MLPALYLELVAELQEKRSDLERQKYPMEMKALLQTWVALPAMCRVSCQVVLRVLEVVETAVAGMVLAGAVENMDEVAGCMNLERIHIRGKGRHRQPGELRRQKGRFI